MRSEPIIVQEKFTVSKTIIWDAITNPDQMKHWFFSNIPDFEPRVGFKTEFDVQSGERIFHHLWKITAAIPYEKIVYDWSYKNIEGKGIVSFELIEETKGTLLKLTNTGLESFPEDIPEFSWESCNAGWNYFIKDSLKKYLTQMPA